MAPLRTTITRSKSASIAASTKQAVLGFTSAKRTASNNAGKKSSRTSSTPVNRSVKQVVNIESSSSEEGDDSDVAEDDVKVEDKEEDEDSERSSIRASTKSKPSKKGEKDGGVTRSKKGAKKTEAAVEKPKLTVEKLSLELQDKAGRWTKHYGVVREKMGNIQPVHGEGQTKVHHILRVFDLSYEYGPCIGVSRIERWERAAALGLNPPPEVREILSTKQAIDETRFSQSVFHDEV